ncbi:hypothetical protein WJX72_003033 [[Myrmecia] bisecta]|uniref:Fungal lipase-type domain-containing protein n=1 Tax=[Myrmecia] bisecta TaxID=41462 RepID=A0AAW1Q011_9CHLO
MLLPSSTASPRQLLQATTDPRTETLLSINGYRGSAGPILAKTADAAQYVTAAIFNVSMNPQLGFAPSNETLRFAGGGRVQVHWSGKDQTIILPFAGWDNATVQQLNTSSDPLISSAINQVLQGHVVTMDDFDPLTNLLAISASTSNNLADAIAAASGGQQPLRIISTGCGPSGGVARLAALWAAINYPKASIRLITFGAPQVGGAKFDWAIGRFVDLVYVWTIPGDNNTNAGATAPFAPTTSTLSVPPNATPVNGNNVTWDNYLEALNYTMANAKVPQFATTDALVRATPLGSTFPGFTTSDGDILGSLPFEGNPNFGPEIDPAADNNVTFLEAYDNSTCPLVLCRARPAATAAW